MCVHPTPYIVLRDDGDQAEPPVAKHLGLKPRRPFPPEAWGDAK